MALQFTLDGLCGWIACSLLLEVQSAYGNRSKDCFTYTGTGGGGKIERTSTVVDGHMEGDGFFDRD